ALQEAEGDKIQSLPWKGRVYFWILNEAVTVVTVGTPDTRTKPEGVFPSSAIGPGFKEWRRDFEQLRTSLRILSDYKKIMVNDFAQYVNRSQLGTTFSVMMSDAVEKFFKQIDGVAARLDSIDRQNILKERYSFSRRVHVTSLLILMALVFLLGIIVPLSFLVWNVETDSVTGSALLVIVLVLVLASFIRFGWDIAAPVRPSPREYVVTRWHKPLLEELSKHSKKLEQGGLLDLDMFRDVAHSPDRSLLSTEESEALDAYNAIAEEYNKKALELNRSIIESIEANEALAPYVSKYGGKGGPSLHPIEIMDNASIDRICEGMHKQLRVTPNANLVVEISMQRWSHLPLFVSGQGFLADPGKFCNALRGIGTSIIDTPVAREYIEIRDKLTAVASNLRELLEASS
ncbi:hypothetical protein MYX77_10835, partial [Acidobacteriia bacterium AH_259_A11_L15]|nr:hypothetical protein [Acidobacteriia bacterium AH_259_A11_L15]